MATARTKAKMCAGKKRFRDFRDAERFRFAMCDRTGTSPAAVHSYRCKNCNTYHVGHEGKKRQWHA